MTAVDLFNSIFNPACSLMADVFYQFGLAVGFNYDFNQVCTFVGDLFRSLLSAFNFQV
jgi:hypothetical protein